MRNQHSVAIEGLDPNRSLLKPFCRHVFVDGVLTGCCANDTGARHGEPPLLFGGLGEHCDELPDCVLLKCRLGFRSGSEWIDSDRQNRRRETLI